MLVQTGGIAASLALAANAFLVPSTMSLPDMEDREATPMQAMGFLNPETQVRTARLECPGCPALTEDSTSSSLILQFSTSVDGTVLELNGAPFWPLMASMGGPNPKAMQVPSDVSTTELLSNDDFDFPIEHLTMSSIVQMRHTSAADGSDAEIHDLDLTIMDLAGTPVTLDTLSIRLLTDEFGSIGIIDIIDVPADKRLPAFDSIEDVPNQGINIDDCEGFFKFFCEAQKFAQAKMEEMQRMAHRKPCPGRKHGATQPKVPVKGGIPKFMPFFGEGSNQHYNIEETQGYPNMEHHVSSFAHKFAQTLRRFLVGFVVPVMIGVAAGMTASLLGMVVGTGIAWVWIKFVRGGKRGNASGGQIVLVHEQEPAEPCEKEALIVESTQAEEEPLPVYSQPPQYTEKE